MLWLFVIITNTTVPDIDLFSPGQNTIRNIKLTVIYKQISIADIFVANIINAINAIVIITFTPDSYISIIIRNTFYQIRTATS